MMPKFTILALRRISGVTRSGKTPNTRAAVVVWMSAPACEGLEQAGSRLSAATMRSSICE